MPLYICQPCDFKTEKKSTYNDHLKSKKHLNKTNNCCQVECASISSTISAITTDEQSETKIKELQELLRIKELEMKKIIDEYELRLKQKDEIITILRQPNNIQPINVQPINVQSNNIKPTKTHINDNLQNTRPEAPTIEQCKKLLYDSNYNEHIITAANPHDGRDYIILNPSKLKHTEYKERGIDNAIDIIIKFFETMPENQYPFYCSNKRKNTLYIKTENGWIKQTKENKIEFDKIILSLIKEALNTIQRAISSIYLLFNKKKSTFRTIYDMNYDDWINEHRSEIFNVVTLFGENVSGRFKSDEEISNEALAVKLLKVHLSKMSFNNDSDEEE